MFYISPQLKSWQIDNEYHDNIIYLNQEYTKFCNKIKNKENFVFLRYDSAVRDLICEYENSLTEFYNEDKKDLVHSLLAIMNENTPNIIKGITSLSYNSTEYFWFLNKLRGQNVSFANIWDYENGSNFINKFSEVGRDIILITDKYINCEKCRHLRIKKHYIVDSENLKKSYREKFINEVISECGKCNNVLFAVSAGILSAIIIMSLYKNNPNNLYIDFGLSLNMFPNDSIVNCDECQMEYNNWMIKSNSIDIDVILTAYRRPEVLAEQLTAIKKQTLQPRNIYLYQDGIDSYYEIKLSEGILNEFDGYIISDTNKGVWERFNYANEITVSEYVCLFDDDTVPGERWLENCFMHSYQVEGIYGTNGIISSDNDYPLSFSAHIGWHFPNETTLMVDLVGHSWFLKKIYLSWLLDTNMQYKYKYVGEDMSLSFACQKKRIFTYVPPHPKSDKSLWGSQPEQGEKYGGNTAVAVSKNTNNVASMCDAFKDLRNAGWMLLYEIDSDYVNKWKMAWLEYLKSKFNK
ncbi:MAG: glycosyltransferase family A protein [Selenomonadaceae bacterium]|nr:glycosyltransferase family A protein [Selenomonadaceae bacterium]